MTASAVTTFGQNAPLVALWVAALSLLGLLIRQIGPWRHQAAEAEAHLRDAMVSRIDKLESRLERQEANHRVEVTLSNHQLRNITACFDAMLLLLEMSPDRGPEIVEKIKQMRATQMIAEAEEKTLLRGALFGSMGAGSDPTKSDALNTADHAVSDAKQTMRSTMATRDEVKNSEARL